MSYNHPYRKPQDDFTTSRDMYPDSQRMYHRESGAYRSRVGTTTSEQTHSALSLSSEELSSIPPGKALSFLQSCGLDAGDLKTLAELPEHLISAEKLPELLSEIKKTKAANTSSSRSSMLQHSSSGRSWEDRSHTQSVEYSLDMPVRQSYSHHREQVQTMEDRWGDVQPVSSSTHTYTSSDSNFVVEYNHLKDEDSYFEKTPYAAESSKKNAVVSQSYSNYSRDVSQPTYLSSRDVGRQSHLSSRDVGQSSHLSSRDVGQSLHLSSKDVGQSSHLSSKDVGQSSHLSSRDVGQSSHLSSREVGQPSYQSSRNVGQPSYQSSRDVGQPSYQSSRDVGQLSYQSSRDVGQPSYQSSRDVGQLSYQSSRDVGQPPYQSSRDVGQPSYQSSRDVGQLSYQSSRDVGQLSYQSSRDVGQPSYQSSRDVGQPSFLSNRDVSQPLPLISRGVGQPLPLINRGVGQPLPLINRGVGQPLPLINRGVGQLSNLSSRNVGQLSHLSSRDGGQPSHISSRDVSRSLHQSSRNSQPSHLSSRDDGQPSHRRRPEIHIVPTRKEASDFHGKTPPVFPYACVLCEITVLSNKDWSVHINGPQHANSQLSLVERYPEWDQRIHSARRNDPVPEKPQSRTTQKQGKKSSSRNGSSSGRSSLSGSKSSSNLNKTEENEKCKVVCVKFEVDEVNEVYLKQLLGQFGAIVKLNVFSRMAFVEMGSTDQAGDIVKYFLHNPLKVKGTLLEFSLSSSCSMIQSSCVVSFMPLPAGEGVSSELTAIAKRFGSVKHSLFLPSRGYVEMGSAPEASKLVEHYSASSLKLKGKTINVSFSAEYQKLGHEKEEPSNRSSNRRRRSLSPQRRSHSSRRDSPSPKRRSSAEMSRSRRSSDSKKRDEQQRSKESSRQKSGRDNSSRSRSRQTTSKDQSKQTTESDKEKTEDKMDQSDTVCDDSDLEGVAVIADDCEELNSEDEEYIEIDQELDQDDDDEEQDFSAALYEQDESDDMQDVKDDIVSEVDITNSGSVSKATVSDGSSECKDAKELQEATKDETAEIADESRECREAQELQENQQETKDETVEFTDGFSECKEGKEPQQNQEATKDEILGSTDGSLQCEEVQELQKNKQEIKDETVEITDGLIECKEDQEHKPHQEKQKENAVDVLEGHSDCKELEELQQQQEVQKDNSESMEQETLDVSINSSMVMQLSRSTEEMTEKGDAQEISIPSPEEQYGRVLEVKGFPLAKKYSEHDLLNIGQKCGEVADCCLVRNNRKVEKALIEMVNAADASKLEAESKRQILKLGGKVLRITVSTKYAKIKKRVSDESDSGKAVGEPHVEETLEKVMHVEEKNQEVIPVEEKNEEVMHVEEKNEEVMHVEEKNQEVIPVEEKNQEAMHVDEKNQEVMHVEEKNEEAMHVEEKNEKAMHLEEKIKQVSHSMTPCEVILGMPVERQISEECTEAQMETNLDTVMETSSDEEEEYGKVLRIRNLPFPEEYTEADFVTIAEQYGKVRRHWLFRPDHTGLIEMENASDAQKVVAAANKKETIIAGKHPKIKVSMKHSHLNKRYFQHGSSDCSLQTPAENEQDKFKTQNLKETLNDNQEEVKQVVEAEKIIEGLLLDDAVGTEFVRPVVGYFCNLCDAIYASEQEAKNEHCRTVLHHQKHKECMEQNSST